MMGKLRSGIILSVLLGAIFAGSLPAQKTDKSAADIQPPAGWKGRIEIKDGIRTVINPDQPLYGEFAFELEQDLVIGDENDEHKTFYKGAAIQVDDQGCIYALDYEKSGILKFDASGRYIRTFGRSGQGPGEFDGAQFFQVDEAGRVLAIHSYQKKIEVFSPNGSFEKRIPSHNEVTECLMNPDGSLFAQISIPPENFGRSTDAIVKMDSQGKVVRTIDRYPGIEFSYMSGSTRVGATGHYYSNELVFRPLNDTFFCYGHSSEYKITIMNSSGNAQQIILNQEKPVPLRQKDKQMDVDAIFRSMNRYGDSRVARNDIEKGIPWPKNKPFFSAFLADEKSRLYVMRFRDKFSDGKQPGNDYFAYDVFDKHGFYIYRMKLPLGVYPIIKHGFFYMIAVNKETGSFRIVRYKIKNYDKMKG